MRELQKGNDIVKARKKKVSPRGEFFDARPYANNDEMYNILCSQCWYPVILLFRLFSN